MKGEATIDLSNVTAPGQLTTLALTNEQITALQKLVNAFGPTTTPRSSKEWTWTWDELEAHLLAPNLRVGEHRDGLAVSTVQKTLKDLRALANHEHAPVDLWPPREESWLAYVQYRTLIEQAPSTVLENPRRALKLLLEDYLGQHWPSLRKPFWRKPKAPRAIPPENMLPRFWAKDTRLHPDLLQDRNLKYTLRFLFLSGIRLSDLCALHIDDVHLNEGHVIVTEPKKRGKQRKLYLEPHVLTAKNEKSLSNYLNKVRPALAREHSPDTVFLSLEGHAWTSNVLRQKLAKAGKLVWKPFSPHCTRHRFATSLLIAHYRATGHWNVGLVARQLGDEARTVERYYLAEAEMELAARDAPAHIRRPRRNPS